MSLQTAMDSLNNIYIYYSYIYIIHIYTYIYMCINVLKFSQRSNSLGHVSLIGDVQKASLDGEDHVDLVALVIEDSAFFLIL